MVVAPSWAERRARERAEEARAEALLMANRGFGIFWVFWIIEALINWKLEGLSLVG